MTGEEMSRLKIGIIGAGNVATHLCMALSRVARIVTIYSHTIEHARSLAQKIGCPEIATDKLEEITCGADYYIVSVKDDCIESVAASTPDCGIWAHTSGSVPMDVFSRYKSRYGVFYPLQTFSKSRMLDVSQVPFFIEGCNDEVCNRLISLASMISGTVRPADSRRRKVLHMAGVYACNFANYMWMHANDLLNKDGLDITFMQPLLEETLHKAMTMNPAEAQTGPARRGDYNTINSHLSCLDGEQHDIYKMLSECILKKYNEQD